MAEQKQSAKEKYVLVGAQRLMAEIVRPDKPILYGDVVEVDGDALDYVQTATYRDLRSDDDKLYFAPADSLLARKAVAQVKGTPMPEEEPPVRRQRRRVAA